MADVFLTPAGYQRLKARIGAVRVQYKAVCDDNPAALASGDSSGWHDNFAFEENLRQMHQLARLVTELETLVMRVIVMPVPKQTDRVVMGAIVTWQIDDEAPNTARITGHGDGDPPAHRLSYDSPLGRLLIGARVGEVREIQLGGRKRELHVLQVRAEAEEVACVAG